MIWHGYVAIPLFVQPFQDHDLVLTYEDDGFFRVYTMEDSQGSLSCLSTFERPKPTRGPRQSWASYHMALWIEANCEEVENEDDGGEAYYDNLETGRRKYGE